MDKFYAFNYMNNSMLPGVIISTSEDHYDVNSYDFFTVYVNGDYMGKKLLLSQSDKISDTVEYLHKNSFNNFTSKIDGNSLYINNDDLKESKHIKDTLHVYLNIR